MRVGVVGDLVSAAQDFRNEMRTLFRARPDDEESCARLKAIKEIEHRLRVSGRGAVVDREPDFRLRGLERSDHRTPPLAIGNERGVEKKKVGKENRRERQEQARGRQIETGRRRDKGKPQESPVRPARMLIRGGWLHGETLRRRRRRGSSRLLLTKLRRLRQPRSRA